MKPTIAIITVLLLALLASCGGEADRRMDLADSLMEENPDSAYAILQAIDSAEISGDSRRARHALLTTQARVKTYRNSISDTAALPLLDYYTDHGSDFDRMRAAFYKAEIYSALDNYQKQIFHLSQAEEIAAKLHDDYWLAKIYELEADIYQTNLYYSGSIPLREAAIRHYRRANKFRNESFAWLDLSLSLFSIKEFGRAHEIIDSVISAPECRNDTALLNYGRKYKLYAYIYNGDYHVADSLYHISYSMERDSLPDYFDELYSASSIALYYNSDKVDYLLPKLKESISCESERARYYILAMRTRYAQGDQQQGRLTADSVFDMYNSLIYSTLQQSIVSEQLNFSRNRMAETVRQNGFLTILLMCITIILVLSTALFLLRMKAVRFKKDAVISQISAELASRDKSLSDNQNLCADLSERLLSEQNANNSADLRFIKIFSLYSGQLNMISELCTGYLNATDRQGKNSGYSKVQKCLLTLRSRTNLDQLVAGINKIENGILDTIRDFDDSITSDDIYMLALVYAGMSIRITSMILDKNMSTIYKRRERIVTDIKASSHISKTEMLNFIGTK